ncbi:MAG: hypothetical protein M1834_001198 [Cirrosporium novae-zelandiae]|nr:MAG: hypothetical protein M1834_001198 [Cirrosporium novae-zelandiae]
MESHQEQWQSKAPGNSKADVDPDIREDDENNDLEPGKVDIIGEAAEEAINDIEGEYTIDSDNSPFPEVRANVPNTDDVSLPVNTFRMWFLGCVFALIGSGINSFFSAHYPSVTITSLVTQLLSFPCGCLLASILPVRTFHLFGWSFTLNPDRRFNIKEHTVITIMSNLSFGTSWATDIIQAQKAFYGLDTPVGYQLLLGLTMQLFGLGIAGLAYRFIVEPPQMIWPSTLANAALFETLHSRMNPTANGWKISRYRFFLYVFIGSFSWYWFPSFIFTGLSTFAFICWAAPNNIIVNNLFGMSTGLGLLPTTFDWSQIAYNGSPLVVPFWAQANVFAGWLCFFALVSPILYYTNTWYTAYLPFSSSNSYDNTGAEYNGTRIVDSHGNFLQDKYAEYSPVFMPVTFALGYGISFATMACLPVHIFLYHSQDILQAFKGTNKKDIHARLIQKYKDIAWWWYAALTVIVLALSIMTMYVWDTGMPFWGVLIAFGMACVYIIPVGTVYAVANLNSNVLTVLGEIISGYLLPGRPIAMLIFKFYAYTALSQAMNYCSDMKVCVLFEVDYDYAQCVVLLNAKRVARFIYEGSPAHSVCCTAGWLYPWKLESKFVVIPPREREREREYSTDSILLDGVLIWMLGHINGICDSDQPDRYTCPQGRVNFTSSVVWGAIGPSRLYSIGKMYSGLLHLFWLGALLPVITFMLKKWFPDNALLKAIHWPIFFAGTGNLPPATGINYTTAFVASFIFNKYIKTHFTHWWAKYNYVLSAALDSGVAVSAIVIFFTVIFPGGSLSWWGNNVSSTTVDGKGTPWKAIPGNGTFGPRTWR